MFTHKQVAYYIGFCSGKYTISIPSIKYFKEHSFGELKDNNTNKAHTKALELINEATKNEL